MKIEIRRELAREPFEQKIRRVGQLIHLAAKLRAQRTIEAEEDAVDVTHLKRARTNPSQYRVLSEYLREAKRPR